MWGKIEISITKNKEKQYLLNSFPSLQPKEEENMLHLNRALKQYILEYANTKIILDIIV
jgi:hypothetical protein